MKRLLQSRRHTHDEGEEDDGVASQYADDSSSVHSIISDLDDDEESKTLASPKSSATRIKCEDDTSELIHSSDKDIVQNTSTSAQSDSASAHRTGESGSRLPSLGHAYNDTRNNDRGFRPARNFYSNQPSQYQQGDIGPGRRQFNDYGPRSFHRELVGVDNDRRSFYNQSGMQSYAKFNVRGRGTHTLNKDYGSHVDAPWKHDLHVTSPHPNRQIPRGRFRHSSEKDAVKPLRSEPSEPINKTCLGIQPIQVLLHGMVEKVAFPSAYKNLHIFLPEHRPPLRRDKPVRISLPGAPVRYIYPELDRSFVFIPRAMRPNQQGFGKPKNRSTYGSYGAMSSQRTSVMGGSLYSPSIAVSRRSSAAHELPFANPDPSIHYNRPLEHVPPELGKPVVRLPPAVVEAETRLPSEDPYFVPAQASLLHSVAGADLHLVPEATFTNIPMHHPRPERSLQVADIESPADSQTSPHVPIQHVPMNTESQSGSVRSSRTTHSRQPSHLSQASAMHLSQIPENAIHAPPFQPISSQPFNYYLDRQQQHSAYHYPLPHLTHTYTAHDTRLVGAQPLLYPPMQMAPANLGGQPGPLTHESGGTIYYYNGPDAYEVARQVHPYPQAFPSTPLSIDAPHFFPQQPVFYQTQ